MKVSICGFTDLAKLPPELSTFLFCEYCKEPNLICAFHADIHYEYFKSKLSDTLNNPARFPKSK